VIFLVAMLKRLTMASATQQPAALLLPLPLGGRSYRKRRSYKHPLAKPAVQIHNTTGKPIQTFPSLDDASIQTGVPIPSIRRTATRKLMQAGGYLWRFVEGYNQTKPFEEMKEDRERRKSRILVKDRAKMIGISQSVVQISTKTGRRPVCCPSKRFHP
jgi:hypothetical protein